MSTLPDPVWPVLVLAFIQLVDGLFCLGPVAPIAACFEAVRFPRRLWWVFPVIKFAAAAGLVGGVWVPWLGLVTSLALVLYFLLAVAAHLRVRDLSRNLFLNASGMLAICIGVVIACFVV
ncbi:MAG: DoxX family protein [Propionibacteriaceae bacterium]